MDYNKIKALENVNKLLGKEGHIQYPVTTNKVESEGYRFIEYNDYSDGWPKGIPRYIVHKKEAQ